ncbi:adenylate/guanylate cyclase domain-containing protein [Paenisporosarcina quisquiliarum]|uniref:Adenylate/guanylate cyclase domain-containing protein n=1 Tax=Paenisporosarcina quisquiliarum TaxID=365346 RepID=A0A9X3REP0_9BACL|nr:adenylate/guanylate cyclase domain-containing protein [Paenisporosarcina quisquiliarum]MCZ8538064.1 adenylate/guanylate cyclase domain-containing protein [Paenisporosarcina quisquiliarum]
MSNTVLFHEEREFDLSIEELWTLLSDTNHLNDYIGLFPVQFSTFSYDSNVLHRNAEAKAFGLIKTEWREHAFEWVKNSHYVIERIYSVGPVSRALWTVRMERVTPNRTRLILDSDFTIRNVVGRVVLKTVIIPQLRRIFPYSLAFQENKSSDEPRPQKKQAVSVNADRLNLLAERLRATFSNEQMIHSLLHMIRTHTDDEVSHLKPLKWAHDRGYSKRETIELFLLATKAGILNQQWSLMCPNCRVPKEQTTSLKQLNNTVHCDLCGVDFEMNFDRYVEMQFVINPSIRKTDETLFCLNGPMNSPHVVSQLRIPPGERRTMDLSRWPQELRLRVVKFNHSVEFEDESPAEDATLMYTESGFNRVTMKCVDEVNIFNQAQHEIVVALEETEWDSFALTAREVTSLQLFRDLFATEVLSPDQQIGVGEMTILFTDLKGSTKLYEAIGDALAYSDVKKHFDYLKQHIQAHRGAIIKTIGDSVMAGFYEDTLALKASHAIQSNVAELNASLSKPISIKLGFYSGPVIAVNANDILDYFGRTVNMAARIQNQSTGDDIVISERGYQDLVRNPASQQLLLDYSVEPFEASLQGIDGAFSLVRLKRN